ncbi:hypothetical protein ONS95_011587 [Cadophora gregata]|uniref:uncharacterized protein n=1 Tax=Cadophora gregata TaxID=51156 RepID=UPI0026DD4C27|nr:uncharacterized protein ONS95_011587 [Cadophora gregata]KAK0120181.1 hypothetical protein ONS95_011587 [Cadophora gregata]KAK0121211.1 hypothetical protein ONS96_011388 [Cadophora gregata f. sp. sojae]
MTATLNLPCANHFALKISGPNTLELFSSTPLPVLEPSDILVRVICVSINHVDGKSADLSPSPGATSGSDFSGIVVQTGTGVDTDKFRADKNDMKNLQVGDRVFGGVFGNNPLRLDNGAFAEYVAVPANLVWRIPAGMDFKTASSLGATLATVGLSLFHYLQLPMPTMPSDPTSNMKVQGVKQTVLVYGGGTATGAMAIQVLKLVDIIPITVCSSSSASNALSLGAKATFDYHSPTCGADIREYTSGDLALVLDCITDTASMSICYEALGPKGGRYVALDAFPLRGHTRRSVIPAWVCTPTQFGHAITWAAPYNLEPRPQDHECAKKWYVVAQKFLDSGLISPHPLETRRGGLAAVGGGMDAVRRGEVKGKKLVYPIVEELCT